LILSALLRKADLHPLATFGDADIAGVQMDSRRCEAGTLFVCMPGTTRDSHSFLPDALAAGASAAVVYSREGFDRAHSLGMPAVLLGDLRDNIWRLCDAFFHHPTRSMKVIGITGTNGKTTTAWMVRDLLQALGFRAAYLGTLGLHLPESHRELPNTTPFAVDLYNLLAEIKVDGVGVLAMEVSSHALVERRVDGVEFDLGLFTNLTQDHLDFHGTMQAYAEAKWRLFGDLPRLSEKPFRAAINVADEVGSTFAERSGPTALRFGGEGTDYRARDPRVGLSELAFDFVYPGGVAPVAAPIGGGFNVDNLLAALVAAIGIGIEPEAAARAADRVRPVPGRFEPVPNESGVGVLIDYAHTPDALTKLLASVRPLVEGRVITVFGCGGDRDRTKRPLMAKAASEASDVTVLTSDNPRTEDPESILRDAEEGLVAGRESVSIVDRREAIAHACRLARPGDVVVIAGKGHERYQIVGRQSIPMDEREIVREALAR
jgi:UDP-N-acetylmuramoyl-L-alanyl-D-glutamate--2,6-diaminopimelate ligase